MYNTVADIVKSYGKRGFWSMGDGSVGIHNTPGTTPEWYLFRFDEKRCCYRLTGSVDVLPEHLKSRIFRAFYTVGDDLSADDSIDQISR